MSAGTIEKAFPLTPLQEGMLYHTIRDPAAGIFHNQCTAVLEGTLIHEPFTRAWELAVARHAAFRTFFTWEKRERPLQVVRTQVRLDIDVRDWRAMHGPELERRWQELLGHDRARGFELSKAPLMRLVLVRVAPEQHRLLWSMHHAIIDGWSALVVLDEVARDHGRLAKGGTVSPSTGPSFDSFVGWLEGQDRARDEQFWWETFVGFPGATELPGGRRATVTRATRQKSTHLLSVSETRRLHTEAARRGVTVNTLLMGAWAVMLARHSGRDDVTFGVTVSERPPAIVDVHRAVGLYLLTVPLRAPRQTGVLTGDWLRQLQRTLSDARVHAAPGLSAIQRWAGRETGGSLFNSLIVFEDFPGNATRPFAAASDDLRVTSAVGDVPNDLPLVLLAFPGDRMRLDVVYDPAAITPAMGDRIASQVATVLNGFDSEPGLPLDDIPMLGAQERATLLDDWSGSSIPTPPAQDVLVRFRQQVARTPQANALESPQGSVTYDELNRHANRLAAALIAAGAGERHVIGLIAEKSAAAIAGMLACLEIGAAYAVLDANAPTARLTRTLRSVDMVLAAPGLAERADPLLRVVPLDDALTFPDSPPDRPVALGGTAYIVFTSGSTGDPKGVVVGRNQLAVSTAARDWYYRESPSSFLLLSPLSVDSSVAGVYWTLCTGGTLVIPAARAEQDAEQLIGLMQATRVSHTLMVPALYRALLEHADARQLASLRTVIVAGEACPVDVVRLHVERLPGVELHNEYGPSEATVWATAGLLAGEHGVVDSQSPVTIGRPIPGARIYLLDGGTRPVPIGSVGEICIGGSIVASGYLGQPEEMARRFLDDPFCAGGRLYRTGDQGRYLEDGRLEFLGRQDHQVKIRGFRVEVGEIERSLLDHPAVREAVVSLVPPSLDTRPAVLADALARLSDAEVERLLGQVETMA